MKKSLPLLVALLLATVGLFAQLQFEPGSVDFGQKPITSTTNIEVVITSQINQQVTLTGLSAPFTATPASFAIVIGEQKTITITFNPQSAGPFAETLTATGGIWGTTQMQVSGYAAPATVSFSQTSLDFGSIIMTGHLQQMVTVQSDIAQQITHTNLALPFASNPATINLLPNQPAQVFISFDPTTPGSFYGSLVATGALSGTATLNVSGTATPASIFAAPQTCNFTPLFSGQTETIEIIVTTDINQVVTLTGLSGVFTVNPTELTLTGSDPETVYVTFSPVNPGIFNQTLQLTGDLWGTLSVPVNGECIDPKINVSTTSLDFGEVPLLSPKTMQITISNSGNGTLNCNLTKGNPHFTLPQVAFNITQGGSSSVSVIFTPEFIPTENDTLIITSNDPDNPEIRIPMIGSGLSQVSGEVCGTWYKANSPYYFVGTVTVPETCTLTIEPGVTVNMSSYALNVNGKLICNGLVNDSIFINGSGGLGLYSLFETNELNYTVLKCPTGTNGFYIYSNGLHITNSNITNNAIINHNKSGVAFDDFNDWTWEDKWNEMNPDFGVTTVHENSYEHYSPFMAIYSASYNYDYGVVSDPIVIKSKSLLLIETEFRVPTSNQNCNSQFCWRVNNGNWNIFYETGYSNTMAYWNNATVNIDHIFEKSDTLELMVLNHVIGNNINGQVTYIDNIKITYRNSNLEIINSKINTFSIDNYATDFNTIAALKIDSSFFKLGDNIESFSNYNTIKICNSIISQAGSDAIVGREAFSHIFLDNVSIQNVTGDGVKALYYNSEILINNSTIKSCTGMGVWTKYANSPVSVSNSTILDNGVDGICTEGADSPISIEYSEITNNHRYGVYSTSTGFTQHQVNQSKISGNSNMGLYVYGQSLLMNGSIVSKNGSTGVYSSNVFIENSVVSSNQSDGVYAITIYGNYLTSVYNQGKGVNAGGSNKSYLFNSIVCLNAQYGTQFSGNFDFSYCKINGDPKLADSLGHLLPTSPCIDAADPTDEDTNIPFGMGTVSADMGAYGGPENWVWGGNPIPANGEPDIVKIVDLPQDQGKMVGIQFNASSFDNGHPAYNVSRYSFWRELDENGKQNIVASKTPVGLYFERGAEYWEYVGEMPAMGFQNYGYSAPTLGDSTINGMFWSKFIVVAHTANTAVYWVSQSDSGYSVDNLAPATPVNLAGTVAGVSYNLQWTPSPEEDLQYYAVYRGTEGIFENEPFATTMEPVFQNITLNTDEYEYAVAAFDHSGNQSDLSNAITSPIYDAFTVPQGWSGISSWIMPGQPALENVLAPVSNELVILYNQTGVYWPGQNVNTLNEWESHSGYVVKLSSEKALPMVGFKEQNTVFGANAGWQILPVLSPCAVPTAGLQVQPASSVVMIKEIAGWRVFWPAMGIATLGELLPGKAYYVLTGSNGTIGFPDCGGLKDLNLPGFKNLLGLLPELSSFGIINTPITHVIAIPAGIAEVLQTGDALAVFDNSGTCAGVINIQDKTQASALTVFGDDQTTSTKEGMADGETLHFKVYKSETGTFADADVSFEPAFPNSSGTFASNGVSAIASLKVGALSTSTFETENVQVFPNPGNGKFTVSGISQGNRLEVTDAKGQIIWTGISSDETDINLSGRPAGLYFLKISKADKISFVKLVIE